MSDITVIPVTGSPSYEVRVGRGLIADIGAVLANWLSDYGAGSGLGDANADGFVNFRDIETVLALWGAECN